MILLVKAKLLNTYLYSSNLMPCPAQPMGEFINLEQGCNGLLGSRGKVTYDRYGMARTRQPAGLVAQGSFSLYRLRFGTRQSHMC